MHIANVHNALHSKLLSLSHLCQITLTTSDITYHFVYVLRSRSVRFVGSWNTGRRSSVYVLVQHKIATYTAKDCSRIWLLRRPYRTCTRKWCKSTSCMAATSFQCSSLNSCRYLEAHMLSWTHFRNGRNPEEWVWIRRAWLECGECTCVKASIISYLNLLIMFVNIQLQLSTTSNQERRRASQYKSVQTRL